MDAYTLNELHARLEEALQEREIGLVEADADRYFMASRRVLELQRRMHESISPREEACPA